MRKVSDVKVTRVRKENCIMRKFAILPFTKYLNENLKLVIKERCQFLRLRNVFVIWLWSIEGVILVRDSGCTQSKASRNATFTITNLTWTALRFKPCQCGEKLMTSCLTHGTAYVRQIKSKTVSLVEYVVCMLWMRNLWRNFDKNPEET